jgi:hypothetical protein
MNITTGERLAWQERKAASFVFSPLFCGYDLGSVNGSPRARYQATADYVKEAKGCVGLSSAMAISGAAASPNQGYHSTPVVAFLLTVFNVRLGWWMQNPGRYDVWCNAGPGWGFRYLVAELFGATDESSKFVYLSDGGHFDNLGIYELVKRRCRFIVASDCRLRSEDRVRDPRQRDPQMQDRFRRDHRHRCARDRPRPDHEEEPVPLRGRNDPLSGIEQGAGAWCAEGGHEHRFCRGR